MERIPVKFKVIRVVGGINCCFFLEFGRIFGGIFCQLNCHPWLVLCAIPEERYDKPVRSSCHLLQVTSASCASNARRINVRIVQASSSFHNCNSVSQTRESINKTLINTKKYSRRNHVISLCSTYTKYFGALLLLTADL